MMRQNMLLLFLVTQLLLPNQVAGMRRTFPSSWLLYSGYSSGSSQHSSSSPDSEESNPAPPPAAAGSQGSSGSPASQAYEQGGGSGGHIYSAWRKLDNGTYIRVNDSLRAQDLWYASSPSSVNSSTLDAMDVIEIENGRWVFSEEWAWKWEPKAGQVCFFA